MLDELGDLHAPKGSRKWAIAILDHTRSSLQQVDSEATHAGSMLGLMKQYEGWKSLAFTSWTKLCRDALGITTRQAESLIKSKPGQQVGAVLKNHGGDRKSEEFTQQEDQGNNVTLKTRGNNVEYTIARLRKEDRPDLAKKVEAGELSANAAAIEAGFRHPTCTVVTDDIDSAIRTLRKHYTWRKIESAIKRHKEETK